MIKSIESLKSVQLGNNIHFKGSERANLSQEPDSVELSTKKDNKTKNIALIAGGILAAAGAIFAVAKCLKKPSSAIKEINENSEQIGKKAQKAAEDVIDAEKKKAEELKDALLKEQIEVEKAHRAELEAREAKLAAEKAAKEEEMRLAREAEEAAKKAAEKEAAQLKELQTNLATELETFKTTLKDKSYTELYDLSFKNMDETKEFRNIIKERYENAPENRFTFKKSNYKEYDNYASTYLTKPELARFRHLQDKKTAIESAIEDLKSTIINKLTKPNDKPVNCKSLNHIDCNEEELRAFGEYYDIYPYNSSLRRGEELGKSGTKAIEAMDRVFAKAPALEEEAIVYRAVHGHPIFKDQNEFCSSIKEGMIIKDASYMSTSTSSTHPQFMQFAESTMEFGGALMRIKLPKGTKGVLGGYQEYLLPRNSQIKINKIEAINGVKIADCEYILP